MVFLLFCVQLHPLRRVVKTPITLTNFTLLTTFINYHTRFRVLQIEEKVTNKISITVKLRDMVLIR